MPESQAPPARQSRDVPEPLVIAARLMADASRQLRCELLLDEAACRMGEDLSLDQVKEMATRVGHYGRVLQAAATRACLRCWEPLYSAEDRLSGFCEACRENRRALLAIAVAGGAQ